MKKWKKYSLVTWACILLYGLYYLGSTVYISDDFPVHIKGKVVLAKTDYFDDRKILSRRFVLNLEDGSIKAYTWAYITKWIINEFDYFEQRDIWKRLKHTFNNMPYSYETADKKYLLFTATPVYRQLWMTWQIGGTTDSVFVVDLQTLKIRQYHDKEMTDRFSVVVGMTED